MLRSVISPLILFFWRFEYFFRSISILSQLKFKKCEKERIEKNCEILYNFNNDITFFSFLLFPPFFFSCFPNLYNYKKKKILRETNF